MMQFDKTNFFHRFNTPKKNYSDNEIRFQIEVLARVKRGRLTDGEKVVDKVVTLQIPLNR